MKPEPSINAGRKRARRKFRELGLCACGAKAVDRHHIDGDTFNNDDSNIMQVCRRCHMRIDGRAAVLVERARQRDPQPPKPCIVCEKPAKPLRRGMCPTCYERRRYPKRAEYYSTTRRPEKKQEAMELIHRFADNSTVTSKRTWADPYTAYINSNTARFLERQGRISIDSDGQITMREAERGRCNCGDPCEPGTSLCDACAREEGAGG